MSRENVEIIRRSNDAWNASDMTALRDLYAPDAFVRAPEGWPEPGPFVGRDAVMDQFRLLRESWDSDAVHERSEPVTIGDRVVVRLAWTGMGRGPDLNMEITIVYTVRKGLIYEVEYFWDHAQALESVGLSE